MVPRQHRRFGPGSNCSIRLAELFTIQYDMLVEAVYTATTSTYQICQKLPRHLLEPSYYQFHVNNN